MKAALRVSCASQRPTQFWGLKNTAAVNEATVGNVTNFDAFNHHSPILESHVLRECHIKRIE